MIIMGLEALILCHRTFSLLSIKLEGIPSLMLPYYLWFFWKGNSFATASTNWVLNPDKEHVPKADECSSHDNAGPVVGWVNKAMEQE